uniref:PPM-type phosphatase domain-containing protein n=2 Tax=Panagrolaimus sp. PS1159 TaxID=55785 RepID=A0AC35F1X2_9BILA
MLPSCSITVGAVQGTRPTFEDRVDISANLKATNPYIYVGIYDGHGGNNAAIMAQEFMLKTIESQPGFNECKNIPECMKDAFLELNEKMRKESATWPRLPKTIFPRPGTTATCAFITEKMIHFANVGDSPLFIIYYNPETKAFSSKLCISLHNPDPLTPEYKRIINAGGNMTKRGSSYAVSCQHRMNYLRMTRALGDFWCQNYSSGSTNGTEPILSPEPECYSIPLNEDVVGVLIASDGFNLKEKKINKIVEKLNKEVMAGVAVNFAHRFIKELYNVGYGKMDNVSIVCISFLNINNGIVHRGLTHFPLPSTSSTVSFNNLLTENPHRQLLIRNGQIGYCTTESEKFERIHPLESTRKHPEPGYISPALSYLPIAVKKLNSEIERYFRVMRKA